MCVFAYVHKYWYPQRPEEDMWSFGPKLQVVVSQLMGVLGTKLWSSVADAEMLSHHSSPLFYSFYLPHVSMGKERNTGK